jgi:hypothetical protein
MLLTVTGAAHRQVRAAKHTERIVDRLKVCGQIVISASEGAVEQLADELGSRHPFLLRQLVEAYRLLSSR